MTTFPRRLGAIVLAGALALSVAACGDSDSEGTADTTVPVADGADTTAAPDDTATDDTVTDDTASDGEATDCAADQEAGTDNLSGSAAVLFTADADSGGSDADITPETTLTVSADGTSIDPSTLTVDVGQVFGIAVAEGGNIDGALIGCADGQTILPGVAVGFVITEPGTYPITLDIESVQVGTVTVE